MRIFKVIARFLFLSMYLILPGCEPEVDSCQKTEWPQPKEFEIKLALKLSETNSPLPLSGGGFQYPWEFEKMEVSGTIQKFECDEETTGPLNIGNTYITQEDFSEPGDLPVTYWIGHMVYVYEIDNDNDQIDINLSIQVTMTDGLTYKCTFKKKYYPPEIKQVTGELFYNILLDVYSDSWSKI